MAKLRGEQLARKIRATYLALPDTEETPTWGKPHFRVAGKIFGGFSEENGRTSIGLKLEMEHAAAMVASDPRFSRAAYVGHKGWVSVVVDDVEDWREIELLVAESYRLIAPKRSLAKLAGDARAEAKGEPPAQAHANRPRAAKKSAAKTSAVKTRAARTSAAKPSAAKRRVAKPSTKKPRAAERSSTPAKKAPRSKAARVKTR
jgi:predicted DNA-binding protein (MmcQ/YjbR family)